MNRISAIALLAIASVATCADVIAQQPGLKANIPFDFTVGDTLMPAGEYTVSSPSPYVVELKSGIHVAMVASTQAYRESNSGSELVFDRFASQYFLHQVLCPKLASLNLQIPAGREEKRARTRAHEAQGPVKGDQILVAAR